MKKPSILFQFVLAPIKNNQNIHTIVVHKYHLNIWQAKDAVESARQTIASLTYSENERK